MNARESKTRSSTVKAATVKAVALGAMILSAAGLAVLSSSPAQAAILNVAKGGSCSNTTGNPYCTISAAVANAVAGDTVVVAAGSYGERVALTRSGTSGAPISIVTNEGAIVSGSSRAFDLSGSAWITVRGFTIVNTTLDGIRCVLCNNVSLINNHIKNALGKGISISSSSDVSLTNNRVEDSRFTGIDVIGSTRTDIAGGFVTRSGLRLSGKVYKGIKYDSTTNSKIESVEVFDNSDTGIYLVNGATGNRLKGVIVHHNARVFERIAAGIESRSSNNIVEASITFENEDSGINMRWGGSDGLMVNNVSYLNGDHGIDVLESPNPRIFYNSVYKNVTAGINVEGNSTNSVIMNNVSHDNGINSPRTEGDIRVTTSSISGAVSNYNVVFSSVGGRVYHWGGTYFRKLTSLRSVYPAVEVKGIQADPRWVNPAANNFHLQIDSPAIDSGNSDALQTSEGDQDVEGNPRCDHIPTANTDVGPKSYYDRGAYEYTSNCQG